MTALNAYIRLESTGLWREAPGAQRRDVYVFLGDASLVVANKAETALSHWSLPAIERLNPGEVPALYAPGIDAGETLEIDDADMIEAIERVRAAVHARDPKPGRLRLWAGAAMIAALGGLAVFWLPDALISHAERVVPASKRLELGRDLLTRVEALSGGRCQGPAGRTQLQRLSQRLGLDGAPEFVVLDRWPSLSGHLPGPIFLFDRALVERPDTPEVIGGFAVLESARRAARDPLSDLLAHAGLIDTLQFLATGRLAEDALQAYADALVARPPRAVSADDLLTRFETHRVASTPFANSLTNQPDLAAALAASDPFVTGAAPSLMTDNNWVTLQTICDGR